MKDQHPFWKPKFYITFFVLLTATLMRFAALLFGAPEPLLGGGEWVAVVNIAMATYVAGSVAENKLLQPSPPAEA